MSPLIDAKSRDKVLELVSDASAQTVLGGAPVEVPGYFHQPTILSGVSEASQILSEETLGPVVPIITSALKTTRSG